MGFGLLFIGYFFLLNLTYFGYTDLISALIMLMAFYKLQSVHKYFRVAMVPTALFGVVGIAELMELLLDTLGIRITALTSYTASSRYLLIGFLTIFMLMGIEEIAKEVEVTVTKTRAKYLLPFAYIIFASATAFEFPAIGELITGKPLAVIATIIVFLIFIHMALSLVTIYSAYMHICMPEDINNDSPDKQSRFGFVNKFREHEAEQTRKYAEYHLDKTVKKMERKKKKKK